MDLKTEKPLGLVEVLDESLSSDGDIGCEKHPEKTETYVFTEEERLKVETLIRGVDDTVDLVDSDVEYMFERLSTMTMEAAIAILEETIFDHKDDANFPGDVLDRITLLVSGEENCDMDHESYELETRFQATQIKYHSPYPEVRAVCSPTDDVDMPCESLRAYIVGIFWVSCASFINQFFAERQPTITLSATVLQILIYPSGELLCRILPHKTIKIFKWSVNLNTGPWTVKEQMFATIMTNIGAGSSNFFHYGLVMRLPIFFNLEWVGYGFLFLLDVVTQFFGFGLAGMLRRYVIYPKKAMWPTVLPTLQLNKTLLSTERKQIINGWSISKYKFFFLTFAAMFVYFFIPDYLMTSLATFNWITWIAPHNKKLAFITGSKSGLGFNPWTTFDWSVINYTTPLVLPFFVTANRWFGVLIGGFLVLGMYWSNYKFTGYFPPNNSNLYDNTGVKYNLSRIVIDGEFSEEGYKSYSQPYVGAGYLSMLGAYYAMYTCAFVYIFMNEWRTVKDAFKGFIESIKHPRSSAFAQFDDSFSVMMRNYKEVPDWWYLVTLVVAFCIGVAGIVGYPTGCPVWAIVVVILVSVALVIPTNVIFATTGYLIPGDTLAVIIAAYMVPGNAIASVLCRVFGYNTDEQAETFIGDMKLAHYAKMPPRAVFRGQMIATTLQCLITTGALTWLIDNTPDLCTSTQTARLVCTFPNQVYSNTLLLGIVGPRRTYDVLYPILKWAFLMGGLFAVAFWALRKKFTRQLKYIHPVIIFAGINRFGASYNLSYYTPGLYASLIFQYYIRRRYTAWWTKYNYILSSGFTAGVAFSAILIFFALQYHPKTLKWWGNTVSSAGVDGAGTYALYEIPGGRFGPPEGSWS
ncbi:OPT oligopeptide transporter protein-domain-containing protein [Dipodascopsis tothii]|uniref:OPT oligopeptide transporter protein-domain-containing protein n=1 Tax=Dipodascopsis tothii TaxID=44089 RepID=UPI0034CEDF86